MRVIVRMIAQVTLSNESECSVRFLIDGYYVTVPINLSLLGYSIPLTPILSLPVMQTASRKCMTLSILAGAHTDMPTQGGAKVEIVPFDSAIQTVRTTGTFVHGCMCVCACATCMPSTLPEAPTVKFKSPPGLVPTDSSGPTELPFELANVHGGVCKLSLAR